MIVVEVGVSARVLLLGEEVEEELVDVGRGLSDEEDADDDQHHQRDVVALVALLVLRGHRQAAAGRVMVLAVRSEQLDDERNVEDD